jgi:hypothetical protein
MHDPNVVAPVAVLPPELILKLGVVDVPEKTTVVAAVVPKSGTPAGKVIGVAATATAATVLLVTGMETSLATATPIGVLLPPPPPQATTTAAATAPATAAKPHLRFADFITDPFQ